MVKPLHLLPVLSIMQFFVSRFVPFVLEWWKLEIGDFLSLARWFIQYTHHLQGGSYSIHSFLSLNRSSDAFDFSANPPKFSVK